MEPLDRARKIVQEWYADVSSEISVDNLDALASALVTFVAEVEKLRGENERLRENAVRLARTMASMSEEIGALQSEVHRG